MSQSETRHDLIVMAADKNAEFTIRGILSRTESLRIRAVDVEYIVHPQHDPGCLLRAAPLLRPFLNTYKYSLVILDREGCGQESSDRASLERQIEQDLDKNGWLDRCAAIVIDPELEMWVWSDSPAVDEVLGWAGRQPTLRNWLQQKGYIASNQFKPDEPKSAMEEALRLACKPRSSSLYRAIAEKVGFQRCNDPAFMKLKNTVGNWFPIR
jgi:hypothetical protein